MPDRTIDDRRQPVREWAKHRQNLTSRTATPTFAQHLKPYFNKLPLMFHYGLGYTLYELGRYHEAYRHLRAYTELVPADGWAWCWLGKACEAMGELDEARSTFEKAIELNDDETDAPELLADLDHRHPR